ncbi:MAG: 3-methyl-2-oxobutanoate hydroxymethyltransferase [Promethearchaeota archaeon]|nr:3-methyl-2-oxobutanoate hydroxymethyltransferase [Candidatus Lokiarchaeota archaeon]MCK4479278.1 3-methyl-2-oxobutanoate hydroxymethyltransferase [Candidatus Lokiarchaeota archaeon]TET61370.1 MAG: 3-methyl-2-oxobutanoate hydroxymethyltransferase [Candidatus Lokiarchaeota archaeon]TKJ22505.1 MAG: 3-methyl-2-oxobutanoate hydroxymethyltransferase [Candidatus Lokiarchaeota archaeon Loki_b32]
MALQKITVKDILEKKKKSEKIVTITSYDYSFAKIVDDSDIDLILVGDSLSMVMLGYKNTLSVTMDEMIHHTKAVSRGVSNALIVGDMPFLSYKIDPNEAIKNAGRFIQEGGAEAVKVEGGTEICPTINAMINADIQVMGHIGLTPQAIYEFGGFLVQGKTIEAAKKLILDAKNLEESGVFSIVLESIPWQIAKLITSSVNVPTIGIGAGPYCDGQILVIHDMLGIFTDIKPKFLKYFGNIGESIRLALKNYKDEVINGIYPDREHSYEFPQQELNKINKWFENIDICEEAHKLI